MFLIVNSLYNFFENGISISPFTNVKVFMFCYHPGGRTC